jgi:hypothetical protein
MLIAYRPELENPPREGGFGVITETGVIQLTPGVNHDVPDTKWEVARKNPTVKRLMSIGAIEELKAEIKEGQVPDSVKTLSSFPLVEALRCIDLIHDEEKLDEWRKIEGRVRVRNAIQRRKEAIRTGNA